MVFLGQLLSGFIKIYMLILTLRIFLSWFRLPDNSFTRTLGTFTDPVLDLFRRICPLRIGFFDLSPMIPLLLLINGRSFSLGYILEIILYIVQFFVNIFSFVIAFSVIILLIVDIFMPYNIMPIVTMMKSFISPFTLQLTSAI